MTTAPDPDFTPADLGRFEPGPYGPGITDDPDGGYPTFDDNPARWGLLPPEPVTEAGAAAAAELEAWGPKGPFASYEEHLAEGEQPVPYSLTPGAEAAVPGNREIEAAFTAAEENFGHKPGAAGRLLADYEIEDPETAYELAAEVLDEWDSCDSAAYQDRIEAGLEPEPEAGP